MKLAPRKTSQESGPSAVVAGSGSALKLAYLVSQYPAVNHTFILREIRGLRKLGVELYVASVRPADRPLNRMTPEEVDEAQSTFVIKDSSVATILREHVGAFFSRPGKYLQGLAYALKLGQFQPKRTVASFFYFGEAVLAGRWMEANDIGHFHSHFSSTVGLLVTQMFPVAMSMTIHGPAEFDDTAGFVLEEKIKKSTFVSAISNYARSQLMKVSDHGQWEKLLVSPLGVDPSIFAPCRRRPAPDVFEIISVGRLAAVKAQHILVTAINLLRQQGCRVKLRLVGDGPDRQSLENQVAELALGEQVIFEGWCNQSQVIALYENADIFALASFAEGVPVVLMEAMAMEIPCVATRVAGIPELIRDGVDGLLVSPSSADELAEAIRKLIEDPELRDGVARSGRIRVMDKYDLQKNTERLLSIMEDRVGSTAIDQPV